MRPSVVTNSPIAEGWRLMYSQYNDEYFIHAAWVFYHPKLGTGPELITTRVDEIGEDEVGVFAQTKNTKYYLGMSFEELVERRR